MLSELNRFRIAFRAVDPDAWITRVNDMGADVSDGIAVGQHEIEQTEGWKKASSEIQGTPDEILTHAITNGYVKTAAERQPTPPTAAELLEYERQGMTAHRRALNYVLSQMLVSESPTLSVSFPDATSLLHAVDLYEGTLDYYAPIRVARRDIVQYLRLHPDVDGFAQILGFGPEKLDALFRSAMEFESRAA